LLAPTVQTLDARAVCGGVRAGEITVEQVTTRAVVLECPMLSRQYFVIMDGRLAARYDGGDYDRLEEEFSRMAGVRVDPPLGCLNPETGKPIEGCTVCYFQKYEEVAMTFFADGGKYWYVAGTGCRETVSPFCVDSVMLRKHFFAVAFLSTREETVAYLAAVYPVAATRPDVTYARIPPP